MKCFNCGSLMLHTLTTIAGLRLYMCTTNMTTGVKARHGFRPCGTIMTDTGHVVQAHEPYMYRTGKLHPDGTWTGKMETVVVRFKGV